MRGELSLHRPIGGGEEEKCGTLPLGRHCRGRRKKIVSISRLLSFYGLKTDNRNISNHLFFCQTQIQHSTSNSLVES